MYLSAKNGEGIFFVVRDGDSLKGADLSGVLMDGTILQDNENFKLNVSIHVPKGLETVFGFTAGDNGFEFDILSTLPSDFLHKDYVRIETPLGPVNVRFSKLRAI